MEKFGIYIHIPFCKKKCKYCDFVSFCTNKEKEIKYFKALKNEINNCLLNKKVSTIYIGGGTPSLVSPQYICEILKEVKNKFEIDASAEITIEVNPRNCK